VRDVCEGAAVDERGPSLERLHEVRLQRVGQERGHRAGSAELLGRDRLTAERGADGDRTEPPPKVEVIHRDRDDRHHLRGGGDVEPRLARCAVCPSLETAPPGDRVRVEPDRVVVQEMGVDHRGQEVVRRADRVDVAREVEVDRLLRHYLRAAAAGAAAFDPEHRPEGRLTQAQNRVGAEPSEPVRQ
jgi:hypothetical protein